MIQVCAAPPQWLVRRPLSCISAAPRKVQALTHSDRGTDEGRFASQQRQERGDLVGMGQDVVDREYAAWTQDTSRVRPPLRILDPLRVEEEEIEAGVGEPCQMGAAVFLPQFDQTSETRLKRVHRWLDRGGRRTAPAAGQAALRTFPERLRRRIVEVQQRRRLIPVDVAPVELPKSSLVNQRDTAGIQGVTAYEGG
jgi:hypothetical protein